MTNVWAVTRATFIQSLRSKVGLAAMILLAVLLLAAPMMVNNGAAPLADRIRTFLSYSLGLTGVILAVITIFLGTTFLCADVRQKQIFILAAKPVARWQYVVGRWLGVVLLNVVLLAIAGAGVYAGAQYLRSQPALSPTDRRAVETEVFTARRQIAPDFSRDDEYVLATIEGEIERLRREHALEDVIAGYLPRAGGNREEAFNLVKQELAKMAQDSKQSFRPGGGRAYVFRDVQVAGMTRTASATVDKLAAEERTLFLEISDSLASELLPGRPVNVNGALSRVQEVVDKGVVRSALAMVNTADTGKRQLLLEAPAHVLAEFKPDMTVNIQEAPSRVVSVGGTRLRVEVEKDSFADKGLANLKRGDYVAVAVELNYSRLEVEVTESAFFSQGLGRLREGDRVEIAMEPMMELSYKLTAGSSVPSGQTVRSLWDIGPLNTENSQRVYERIPQNDVPSRNVRVLASGRCVDNEGAVVAVFINVNTGEGGGPVTSITIAPGDISLLYPVGSFGPNLAWALVTILVQLAFIAAVGVLTATFLSFPVAVLTSGALVLFALMMGYITDAVGFMPSEGANYGMKGIVWLLSLVLPNLSDLSPAQDIVNGVEVATFTGGWRNMAMRPGLDTFWQAMKTLQAPLSTLIVLAIGCAIFTKRELARVQV
ncbi:MAG: hypothetical protein FWE88_02470 [Phycisphaerae bacterium]|nr:hypothetical protein [Phycisphaerae bacterium]